MTLQSSINKDYDENFRKIMTKIFKILRIQLQFQFSCDAYPVDWIMDEEHFNWIAICFAIQRDFISFTRFDRFWCFDKRWWIFKTQ